MPDRKVIWSENAIADYHQNIDYLLTEWSDTVASNFIEDVETVLNLISHYPEMYPLANYSGARKAVIGKQITLYYKEEGKNIYLIRLWNNFQDPNTIKL